METTLTTPNLSERGEWTSASNSEADSLCAGRHRAQRGLPEQQSDIADRGTRVHQWLHWQRASANGSLDARTVAEPKLADYSEIELALRCWDLEQEEKRLWLEAIGGDHGEVVECLSEHRQWLAFEHNGDTLKHSGQADVIYRTGCYVLACDTKSGFLEVTPPNENLQLRDIAALTASNTPTLLWEVRVQIIRPFGKRQPPCSYNMAAFVIALDGMTERVKKSNDPDAKRTPNEISCRYCRAKGTSRCPESQAAVVTLSATAQELIARPTAEFLDACKLAMSIAKQAQQNAKALLSVDPDAIPGYTLEPNEPMRPIVDAQEAWNRAAASGITLEQFMATVKVGKTELEALLKAKHRDLTNRDRIPHGEWSKIMSEFHAGILGEVVKEPSLKRHD